MKKSILLLICFLSTALPSISQQEQKSKDWWLPKEPSKSEEKFNRKYPSVAFSNRVSLVQLISNPERFDGQTIWVEGCLCDMYETHALFLSADDLKHRINLNSIQTLYSPEVQIRSQGNIIKDISELNVRFVGMQGIFHAKTSYESRGILSDIVRVYEH